MAKFKKKPVEVEVERVYDLLRFAESNWVRLPEWIKEKYEKGEILFTSKYMSIKTLDGRVRADVGDYLIKGIKGEIYSCKPDIFSETYEPVVE